MTLRAPLETTSDDAPGAAPRRTGPGLIERGFDGVLDGAVVAFAVFTVLFHVAVVFGLRADVVAAIWVVTVAAVLVTGRRRFPATKPDDAEQETDASVGRVPALVLGAAAVVTAGAAGIATLDEPGWWWFWGAVIVILAAATVTVVRARPVPASRRVMGGATLVLAAAIICAFFSAAIRSQNGDDVFLVNRSVAVEQGSGKPFPERDTIFSDEQFAVTRPENPAMAIEPFIGVIARALPVPAPTVAYLLLAPLISALAVGALWRLLRVLRAPNAALAAVCGAVFLALDGEGPLGLGNTTLRGWHGKYILAIVIIPLAWRHAVAWGRDGDRRALALLIACGIAGAGLSSTAVFVMPVVIAVGVGAAALAVGRYGSRLVGAAIAIAYPVGVGLFALVAAEQSSAYEAVRLVTARIAAPVPPTFIGTGRYSPTSAWHIVLGTGVPIAIATGAVLLSWLTTRDRAARLVLLLAPLTVFIVFFFPGALDAMGGRLGADSLTYRVVWIVPLPAAVGLVVTSPFLLASARWRRVFVVAVPVVVAAALLTVGTPVWSNPYGGVLTRPGWDLHPQLLASAQRLIAMSEPGDLVAAPEAIGMPLAISSANVWAVNPRGRYMSGRHAVPEFHAPERRLVTNVVTNGVFAKRAPQFVAALDTLGVDTARTNRRLAGTPTAAALRRAGFERRGADRICIYWRRASVADSVDREQARGIRAPPPTPASRTLR